MSVGENKTVWGDNAAATAGVAGDDGDDGGTGLVVNPDVGLFILVLGDSPLGEPVVEWELLLLLAVRQSEDWKYHSGTKKDS